MSETDKTIKIINAIGEQWPFILTIFIIVVICIKWKTIWKGLVNLRIKKIKSGNLGEVEFDSPNGEEIKHDDIGNQKVQQEEVVDEEKNEIKNTLYDCYNKLSEGDYKSADEIFERIKTDTAKEEKFSITITYMFYKFLNGDLNIIDKLNNTLLENNLGNRDKYIVYYYLGLCYKKANNKEKAIYSFNEAIKSCDYEAEKITCIINISQIHLEYSEYNESKKILLEYLKLVKLDKSKIDIYKELANIYKSEEKNILHVSTLEKAIELCPNDTSLIFDLAYSYSNIDFEKVSIFHYFNLLNYKSNHSTALNNLGVGLKKQDIPIEAVKYYKKAVENNNTLAAGNLAFLYLEAGFYTEALELVNKFKSEEDVEQMLVNAHNSLIRSTQNENKNITDINKIGKNISLFFRNYATTVFAYRKDTNYQDSYWTDKKKNKIYVEIKNNKLRILWSEKNSFFDDDDKYTIEGEFSNKGLEIKIAIPTTITSGGLLSLPSESKKPSRTINIYHGYCSTNIEAGIIEILYIINKDFVYNKIWKTNDM